MGCSCGMIVSCKVLQVVVLKNVLRMLFPYHELGNVASFVLHLSYPSMPQPVWHKLEY